MQTKLQALEDGHFDDLLCIIQASYKTSKITEAWDSISQGGDGVVGDNFATFLVKELMETFDPSANSSDQIIDACLTLDRAVKDLQKMQIDLCGNLATSEFSVVPKP